MSTGQREQTRLSNQQANHIKPSKVTFLEQSANSEKILNLQQHDFSNRSQKSDKQEDQGSQNVKQQEEILSGVSQSQSKCVVCQKETTMHCPCDPAISYCSPQHQLLHWEQGHWKSHEDQKQFDININEEPKLGSRRSSNTRQHLMEQDLQSPTHQLPSEVQSELIKARTTQLQSIRKDSQSKRNSIKMAVRRLSKNMPPEEIKKGHRRQNPSISKIFINENDSSHSHSAKEQRPSIENNVLKSYVANKQADTLHQPKEDCEGESLERQHKVQTKRNSVINNQQKEVDPSTKKRQHFQNEKSHSSNNDVNTSLPMSWNESFKIFEVNLSQKEESKWLQILILLAKNDINSATVNAERMFEHRKQTIEENKKRDFNSYQTLNLRDIYGLVSEGLLLAKCKLLKSNVQKVEELLIECEYYLGEMKINVKEIKRQIHEAKKDKGENKSVVGDDKSSAYTTRRPTHLRNRVALSNIAIYVDYKWMLSAYSSIAAFYNAIGNQKRCEMSYVKYAQWIEKYYGKDSLEASNCYFLIGLYYFEQASYQKSLACFIKCLYLRRKELGEAHASCSDCYLNMGIIYKNMDVQGKALQSMETALQIRRDCVGTQSLPVSKVLEELGKYFLERGNYKQSYACFQECYEIRKKILRKSNNEEVERISCLLLYLHKNIEKQLKDRELQNQYSGAKLVTLGSQVKDIFKKQLVDTDYMEEEEDFLTADKTTANKTIKEVLSRRKQAQESEKQAQEEKDKRASQLQQQQFEKALSNYVGSAVSKQEEDITDKQSQVSKSSPYQVQKRTKQVYNAVPEDEDVESFITKGFTSYFGVVKAQLFDRVVPYIITLFLSLSSYQITFLQKCQVNKDQEAPLYIPQEFKDHLHPFQQNIFSKSQVWKIPRCKYLEGEIDTSNLIVPEAKNKQLCWQLNQKDRQFLNLLKEVPDFIQKLNDIQQHILKQAIKDMVPLKYFFISVSTEQMKEFESIVIEQKKDAEYEEVLQDLAKQTNIGSSKQKTADIQSITRILDYRHEMCRIIDSISMVDIFRNIDVDLPGNFLSNLELNQIQRLTKLKAELQNPTTEIDDVQLTLKRFISDLDVKEAYEFSILNPFLINEEALQQIIIETTQDEESQAQPSKIPQLDLEKIENSSREQSQDESEAGSSDQSEERIQKKNKHLLQRSKENKAFSQDHQTYSSKEGFLKQLRHSGLSIKLSDDEREQSIGEQLGSQPTQSFEYVRGKAHGSEKRKRSLMNTDLEKVIIDAASRANSSSYERQPTAGARVGSFSFTANNVQESNTLNNTNLNMIEEYERDDNTSIESEQLSEDNAGEHQELSQTFDYQVLLNNLSQK